MKKNPGRSVSPAGAGRREDLQLELETNSAVHITSGWIDLRRLELCLDYVLSRMN